jgi:hypothetical protein
LIPMGLSQYVFVIARQGVKTHPERAFEGVILSELSVRRLWS